ncbi:Altered inheritance of mitochondria protein 41, mitochondrial [Saliniradius amylolyticus]|uniref:Altered inheritance of mitochondria protein 41, mitochondrial n=1 Tax=Saliniradius amylolyticus TaxID=2183582 RepID=A0A2S2E0F1_9ALTE|nr:GatB/YqeY domain-containing protein [Saliniradius amylolyticus]AWL11093.1 Altered inheritance of mitochondria protein 41, mitochondrial [Saliniradius amylolyticus]
MSLIDALKDAQKQAMRAKDKVRLGTVRMALSSIKQQEIDTREPVSDADALTILIKMVKQRNEALHQYQDAGREDLAAIEQAEIEVLEEFLPKPLSDDELQQLIGEAIAETGAARMQDMGKVMGWLKPKVQGRADMGQLSAQIKQRLS